MMLMFKFTLQVPEVIIKDGIEKLTSNMLLEFPNSFNLNLDKPISSRYDVYRDANFHQLTNGRILIEWK